jgi:actin-related protein
MVGMANVDLYVGDVAQSRRGILSHKSPIEHGVVQDWDGWERLVHHTFYNELRIDPEQFDLLFTVPILNPHADVSRQTQILFEVFGIPSLCGAYAPVLSMYASGRVTGVVCSIGAGLTQIVPIYCCHVMQNAIIRTPIAGNAMTSYLARMLTERSTSISNPTSGDLHFDLDQMKRELCYTAVDYNAEMDKYSTYVPSSQHHASADSSLHRDFTMGDGTTYTLGSERIRCSELLFKPKLMGFETPGLHHLIYKSIMQCPLDTRRDFYNDIVPVGGCANSTGFMNRLQVELTNLAPSTMRIRIAKCQEKENLTWVGGSIFGSLNNHPPPFFSKQEYDEIGANGIFKYGGLTLDPSLKP